MILHRKLVLHVEAHRGSWPRLSVRLAPRSGDRVVDGGIPGRLRTCELCSGDGVLLVPDYPHRPPVQPPIGATDREHEDGSLCPLGLPGWECVHPSHATRGDQ